MYKLILKIEVELGSHSQESQESPTICVHGRDVVDRATVVSNGR